uniref:Uncharacterized protein n=1 Tax=Cacopsylla melanoneura TaxID=428564 RepID=A0A8D8ZFG9_9HEMI
MDDLDALLADLQNTITPSPGFKGGKDHLYSNSHDNQVSPPPHHHHHHHHHNGSSPHHYGTLAEEVQGSDPEPKYTPHHGPPPPVAVLLRECAANPPSPPPATLNSVGTMTSNQGLSISPLRFRTTSTNALPCWGVPTLTMSRTGGRPTRMGGLRFCSQHPRTRRRREEGVEEEG